MPPTGRPSNRLVILAAVGLLTFLRASHASTRTTISGNRLPDIVPGRPGTDYPVASRIPETRFTCDRYSYSGFFADPETGCQAFHVCRNKVQTSFLCPNGTLFHQRYLICDWWFNVDCSKSVELYDLNQELLRKKQPQGLNPTTAAALSLLTTPSAGRLFDKQVPLTTTPLAAAAVLTKDPIPTPSSARVDPLLTAEPTFGLWTLHHVTPPTDSSSEETATRGPAGRRLPVRDARAPFGDSPFADSPFQPASAFAMTYGSERPQRDSGRIRSSSSYSDSYTTSAPDTYDSYESSLPPVLGQPEKWTFLAKDTDMLNNIALSAQFYVGSKTEGKGFLRPKSPSRADIDPEYHPFQGFQSNKNRDKGSNRRPPAFQQDFNGPNRQPNFDGQLNRPELQPPFINQNQQNFVGGQNFLSADNFQSSQGQNFQNTGSFQTTGLPGSFQTAGSPGSFLSTGSPESFLNTGSSGSFQNTGSSVSFQNTGSPGSFQNTGSSGSFQDTGSSGLFQNTGSLGAFQNTGNAGVFDGTGPTGSSQSFGTGTAGSFQGIGSTAPFQSFQNTGSQVSSFGPGIQPTGSSNPFQSGATTGNQNAFQIGTQSPFDAPANQRPSLNPNFDSTSVTDFGSPSLQNFPTPPQAQISSVLPVPDIPPTSSIAQVATFPSSDPASPPATNIRVTLVEQDDNIPVIEVGTVAPDVGQKDDDFKASPLISVNNDNWRPSSGLSGSTSTSFDSFSNPGQIGPTGIPFGQVGQIDPFGVGQVGQTNFGQVGQTGSINLGQYGQTGPIAPGIPYTPTTGTITTGQNDLYDNLQFTVQPGAPIHPFQQVRLPVTSYNPPQPSYGAVGPPVSTYSLPKSTYGAPQSTYGPPKNTYGAPQSTYGPPKSTYGPPQSTYGPPQSTYGAPLSTYGTPQSNYGAPQSTYGPPQSTYGAPQSTYGAPQSTYGPPQSTYGAPQSTYGPPQPQTTYGAPQQGYGAPPSQNYGVPKSTYGAPKATKAHKAHKAAKAAKGYYGKGNKGKGLKATYGVPKAKAPKATYGAPQQGYSAPQKGYGAPQQGYGAPQQGYGAPQQGYTIPQHGYSVPQQGYNVPQQGYASPPQGYTASQLPLGAIGPISPAHTPFPTNIQATPQAFHLALNNQNNYNVVPTAAPLLGTQYASSVISQVSTGSQFVNTLTGTGYQQTLNPVAAYNGGQLSVIPATTIYQQPLLATGRANIQPPQVITPSHLPLEPHPSISIQESRQLPPPVPTSTPIVSSSPTKGMEKVDSVPMKPSLLLSVNAVASPSPSIESLEPTTWRSPTPAKRSDEQTNWNLKIVPTSSVTHIKSFDRRNDRDGVFSLTS